MSIAFAIKNSADGDPSNSYFLSHVKMGKDGDGPPLQILVIGILNIETAGSDPCLGVIVFVLRYEGGPKNGPKMGPPLSNLLCFFDTHVRTLACMVSIGRRSLVGKRPRLSFQRCRNRCIHFFAAALRAGRHDAAPFPWLLWLSMVNAHRFSHTN